MIAFAPILAKGLVFTTTYWKYLLGGILVLAACASISNSIYTWGYNSCKKEWTKAEEIRVALQTKQSKEFTELTKAVSDAAVANQIQSDKNLAAILLTVKNKPLYKVIDGKCYPSDDFEKAYINIIGSK